MDFNITQLPPSRFIASTREVMQKIAVDPAMQAAMGIGPSAAPAAAAPAAASSTSLGHLMGGTPAYSQLKTPWYKKAVGWKGILATLLGGAGIAAGIKGYSGIKSRFEADANERENLLQQMRDYAQKVPGAPPGEEAAIANANRYMQNYYTFNPDRGIYVGRGGELLGNTAYNRRLGSAIRSHVQASGMNPETYKTYYENWKNQRQKKLDEMHRQIVALEPFYKKPGFWKNTLSDFNPVPEGMFQ